MTGSDGAVFLVRVWLPDRPGALGAVASRLGAVKGDVVGIEILERGAGRVVDELVVRLPAADLVDLMVRELWYVDGVSVEDVWPIETDGYDPERDAIEVAAELVECGADELAEALCAGVRRVVRSSWSCLIADDGEMVAASGDTPEATWLTAFVAGTRYAADSEGAVTDPVADTLALPLNRAGVTLVIGRDGMAFRARERERAAALTAIADATL